MNETRYSRQHLFAPIGKEGQRKLYQSSILIVGVGALGTVLANHMVRAGVGHVVVVDRDFVEESNLQRQMLFDEADVREHLPKAIAAQRKLQLINSDIEIEAYVGDVTPTSLAGYAGRANLILDGTDNFHTRFIMNDYCFQQGIPYVYGGAVSSRGMQATFIPNETPCLRCLIDDQAASETCDTSGVIAPIIDIVASYQATEAIKYLLGSTETIRRSMLSIDIWRNDFREIKWSKPKDGCPTCGTQEYPSLQPDHEDHVTSLCGRETIQITPRQNKVWDLNDWAERLEKVGEVKKTPFLVRCTLDQAQLVLFPDGRVLIQGIDDVSLAKSMYAKYIGM